MSAMEIARAVDARRGVDAFESMLAEVSANLLAAPRGGLRGGAGSRRSSGSPSSSEPIAGPSSIFDETGPRTSSPCSRPSPRRPSGRGRRSCFPNWTATPARVSGSRCGGRTTSRRPGPRSGSSWLRTASCRTSCFRCASGTSRSGSFPSRRVTSERDWSPELLTRFRLFGEILASAIVRDRRNASCARALAEISRLKERAEAENVVLREDARDASRLRARSSAEPRP